MSGQIAKMVKSDDSNGLVQTAGFELGHVRIWFETLPHSFSKRVFTRVVIHYSLNLAAI